MSPTELKKLFKTNPNSSWIIDHAFTLPTVVKNKNYVTLKCKRCGNKKNHTVGNIKHLLLKDIDHIRCLKCYKTERLKRISDNILHTLEIKMRTTASFPWVLNHSRIKPGKIYTQKTHLPLSCKICKTNTCHTPSNIQTSLKKSTHICCRVCKLTNFWKVKIDQRTNREYELNVNKTAFGFKIIHKKCGNYYYSNNPKLIKKGACPYCFDDPLPLEKIKDLHQFYLYIQKKSEDKITFHDFNFNNQELTVSCNSHPARGKYKIKWKSFLLSKLNNGVFLCNLCKKQRLRRITHYDYNEKIKKWALEIENKTRNIRIDSNEKLLHRCLNSNYHPPFYASPYEIEFKNKRCMYCFTNTAFHKGYDFIKNYIEMDTERFLTHCGRRFRLLSTKEEAENQLKPNKNMNNIILRINELTCTLHSEYETTWGNFYHKNSACTKCSKENKVSYAHAYYQALLEYFHFDYIPEFPLKINERSTYYVDFKLSTFPNYVEIDSNLHTPQYGWDNDRRNMERDKQKDLVLTNNLERIKLYDDNHRALPINVQINLTEASFLDRAVQNGISITKINIEEAKKDPDFFVHARILYLIKRLSYFHGNHIEYYSKKHLDVLKIKNNKEAEFYCKINQEVFKRTFTSVVKLSFLCPICLKKIKYNQQQSYYLSKGKIDEINRFISLRFNDEFAAASDNWGNKAFFFRTVVFPIYAKSIKKEIFVPLRDLLNLSPAQVKKRLINSRYDRYKTNRKNHEELTPVIISNITSENRTILHQKSKILFEEYHKKAKLINRIMKKKNEEIYIQSLIEGNENLFNEYFHRNRREATHSLLTYDRKIIPFFAKNKAFELLTPRLKYAHARQLLLLRCVTCSHLFYSSWNYIGLKIRKGNPIQCQYKECYDKYYQSANPTPRKIPQEKLLKIFKKSYHGQYFPLNPDHKIMVRIPIEVIHLPSGKKMKISVDNFRRGKFKCSFKKYTQSELRRKYPGWYNKKRQTNVHNL